MDVINRTAYKLVWRQSEFAFLCVGFDRRTFCLQKYDIPKETITMTTKEAEEQYYREVEEHIELHISHVKKMYIALSIVGVLMLIVGIILTLIGFTSQGYKSESIGALLEKIFGITLLCVGTGIVLYINIYRITETKKGPKNFLPQ